MSGPSTSAVIRVWVAIAIPAGIACGLLACASRGGAPPTPTSSATATGSATATVNPPKSWRLAFSSSFSGSRLNSATWATCYPWAPKGCTNFGNDDEEKEWYLASQARVENGVLNLIAQREPTSGLAQDGKPLEYDCRSGMVTTYPGFRFEYGFVQVTARIPFATSLWPAFWLAAANKVWPPEIDLLEHWDSQSYGSVYLHPTSGIRQGGRVATPDLAKGWHTFALSWTKSRLTWYYDGQQVLTTTTGIPRQAMYFIADLAVYSATPGHCSGSLLVKSVDVWQPTS